MQVSLLSKKYFYLFLFISCNILAIECKAKKKLPEFYDPIWRDESTKISTEICKRLSECFEKQSKNSKSSHIKTHVQKNLQTSKCTEKHKKSNVYFLRGANPEEIKKNFLTCYENFKTLSCEQIYSGAIQNFTECKWINELQKL